MSINCICNSQNCFIKIWMEEENELFFRDKKGNDTLMYVDEESIKLIIEELKYSLKLLKKKNKKK